MSAEIKFPEELLLNDPGRRGRLIAEFYQQYGESRPKGYYAWGHQHEEAKTAFYRQNLVALGHDQGSLGVDIGCQGGVLISFVNLIRWVGVDIDKLALEAAREAGVACHEMDFTSAIDFRDESFDVVMMTEVLEHLPYPSITVREVHRILKKKPAGAYVGSAPLDYHLHRRWKVLRGKRLSGEQTHVHHFSFKELDRLLRFYFEKVDYLPLSGTAARHPNWNLSYNLFVRDIAWAASGPRPEVGRWAVIGKELL
ncbi:MAG TPA: class I SAM-dependent methyltransferase [Chthoniobacterales bacterium]